MRIGCSKNIDETGAMKGFLNFYKNRLFYASLILGLGSLLVFLLFRYIKGVELRHLESQTQIESKSIAMNLDLIMANYVLKTQNLEDFLEIKKIKSATNQQVVHTVFDNTIFGTFSVLRNTSPFGSSSAPDHLNMIRLFRIVAPNKKTVPVDYKQNVRTEAYKKAIREMIKDGDRQKQFFVNLGDYILYVIINRSKEDKNYFYVLTGQAQDLFDEALPKHSSFIITIEQQMDKSFWLIEKSDENVEIQKVTSLTQSQRIHTFSSDFFKLDYETQFSPKKNFVIAVYAAKNKKFINMDRAILLFFISATILFIAFLIFYLTDRNFRIQELVHLRTKELKVETERSKQATIAKSRFLASISHEIRTPLNIVLGMTDLLEETTLTQVQTHYLQSIRTSGRHLLSLLSDILDMTRIDLKEVIFKPTQVDTLDVIAEACLAINEVAMKKNIKLYCKISPQVPRHMFIDHARLKQIIINLLMNAVKYTEKGAVELNVDVQGSGGSNSFLSIQVSDTGIGIADDNLEHIFKSFFQVDQKGANLSKGVGLGLSIVASIVKRLKGDVQVRSKLGEGSVFLVQIPIIDIQSVTWPGAYLARAKTLRSKILFLSRDEKTLNIMQDYNKCLNLEVIFKTDLAEISLNENYEFAFVDVDMAESVVIARLNSLVRQKLFVFDFDPKRPKEHFWLDKKIETISHRLFLPQLMFEMLDSKRFSNDERPVGGAALAEVEEPALSVLIVEDDASNRILFQAYLAQKKNWRVDYANNGLSALQDYLGQRKYDVMVTDLQMPEMDGFTLLSNLSDTQKPPRVIILSADSTEETAQRAKNFKVNQFMTKPVRKKDFIDAIQGSAV